MKYLLLCSLSLVLVLGNVARADSFDSDEATVKKSNDKTAKVTVDKHTYMVPITFKDDSDWSAVKDHYELSPESVGALKSGCGMAVAGDGTLSFMPCSSSKKHKM